MSKALNETIRLLTADPEEKRRVRTVALMNRPAAPAPFTGLKDISEPSPVPTAAGIDKEFPFDPNCPGELVPGHRTCVRVFDYGNGYLEASVGLLTQPRKTRARDADRPEPSKAEKADNWERGTQRARQKVRRLVLANEFDRILTLTTRACIDDPATFWAMWKRFLRLARKACFDMPYVAVLEYQKRGAAHIHAAVRGHYPHTELRALWLRVIAAFIPGNHPSLARDGGEFAPNDGSVQLEYRADTNPARLASYLSKYLTKQAAEDLAGAHRYRASIGLKQPAVKRFYVAETDDLGNVAGDALIGAGAADCITLAGDLHGWACNWDRRGAILGQPVPWNGLEMGHAGGAQCPRRP